MRLETALRPWPTAPGRRREVSRWNRLVQAVAHAGIGAGVYLYGRLMRLLGWRKPAERDASRPWSILVTGKFFAESWVRSHLEPLAGAERCGRVMVVSTSPVPPIENVEPIYPPSWLRRTLGQTPARLLVFSWTAWRRKPDMIAGFHLLLNGLLAALLARALGRRSMYFCVGGPMEVLDGGIHAENRLFGLMHTPNLNVEKRLIRIVSYFDCVVTMGTRAVQFFRRHGIRGRFHVVPGGIEPSRFRGVEREEQAIDVIFIGRLAPVKRIDLFLRALRCAAAERPGLRAVVLGDGPLRSEAEAMARALEIEHVVRFLGHRQDVESWLARARVFVLTSDSEGLALSLMEAMTCGVPAVVSDVGDLPDLVEHGVNGYLVRDRRPEIFAGHILDLLDDARHARFSAAATAAASRFQVRTVARTWDDILGSLAGSESTERVAERERLPGARLNGKPHA